MDSQQTKIFSALLVAAVILGIIVAYFIITIVRNQRTHIKLQQMNLLVEITTLENERKRIVSDLHDELGPLLSVVKFQVSSLESDDSEDLELINKASDNLDLILERIRGICNQMMPQVLIRKGLLVALKEFVHEVDASHAINIEFRHDDELGITGDAEIHLYRMVQEIVNNTLKHAFAKHLKIELRQELTKLVMNISDDGVGFNTETLNRENCGFGLKNIVSRANILKADLYLSSSPGEGTSYTIEIPAHEI
jgi:signal transduction histidine kinase